MRIGGSKPPSAPSAGQAAPPAFPADIQAWYRLRIPPKLWNSGTILGPTPEEESGA